MRALCGCEMRRQLEQEGGRGLCARPSPGSEAPTLTVASELRAAQVPGALPTPAALLASPIPTRGPRTRMV